MLFPARPRVSLPSVIDPRVEEACQVKWWEFPLSEVPVRVNFADGSTFWKNSVYQALIALVPWIVREALICTAEGA